jgi:hypothetical protein
MPPLAEGVSVVAGVAFGVDFFFFWLEVDTAAVGGAFFRDQVTVDESLHLGCEGAFLRATVLPVEEEVSVDFLLARVGKMALDGSLATVDLVGFNMTAESLHSSGGFL